VLVHCYDLMMRKQFAHSHEAQIRMGRCCATRTVAMENEKALRLNPTRELECRPSITPVCTALSPSISSAVATFVVIGENASAGVRMLMACQLRFGSGAMVLFSVSPINSIRGCSLSVVSGMVRMRATDGFALQSVCQMRRNGLIAGWCHLEHHIAKVINIIRILSLGSCEESSNTRS